jgi:hypothetical protein
VALDEQLHHAGNRVRRPRGFFPGLGDLGGRIGPDTLIYLDLPQLTLYWWVTKRFLKAAVAAPEGRRSIAGGWSGFVTVI